MDSVKMKMLQLKRQLSSLSMEADTYEEELSKTNSEAERIGKMIEDYQYSTRFNNIEDSLEYATKDIEGDTKYISDSSRKRKNRFKARRHSQHEIKGIM